MDASTKIPSVVANPINAIALPIFAVIAIVLTYLPFRSFYRLKNFPACNLVIVNDIVNLFTLVNAILWSHDDFSTWWPGYGLCDIQALLKYPLTLSLACSLCCLSKGMADCLDTDKTRFHHTAAHNRRVLIMDILFCWGLPIMEVALHYVVQNGRYAIVPVVGCIDQLDNSWPVIIIILIWAPLISLLNVYYAIIILIRLRKHRYCISNVLSSTGSGLGAKKFIKLVFISISLLIIYLPIQSVFVYRSFPTVWQSYSWSRIHNPLTWSPIAFVHTVNIPYLQYYPWASIGWNFTVFSFFGFNDSAIDIYRACLVKCGFGRIWPSLKESRQARQIRTGSESQSSFKSRLDLVGKAMHYFDNGGRKDSQATTLVCRSDGRGSDFGVGTGTQRSRKDSQGTFEHLSLANVTTNTSASTSSPLPPPVPHANHLDLIESAPPFFTPVSYENIQRPEPVTQTARRPGGGGFPRLFKTHINMPFSMFSRHSAASISSSARPFSKRNVDEKNITVTAEVDLDAQPSPVHTFLSTSTAIRSRGNTETNIWATNMSQTQRNSNGNMAIEEDVDPLVIQPGTKAWRKCEKKEVLADKEGPIQNNTRYEVVRDVVVEGAEK